MKTVKSDNLYTVNKDINNLVLRVGWMNIKGVILLLQTAQYRYKKQSYMYNFF